MHALFIRVKYTQKAHCGGACIMNTKLYMRTFCKFKFFNFFSDNLNKKILSNALPLILNTNIEIAPLFQIIKFAMQWNVLRSLYVHILDKLHLPLTLIHTHDRFFAML
jgi:hypothetical protein